MLVGAIMDHRIIKGVGGDVHYWISRTNDALKGTNVFTFISPKGAMFYRR